jgi:glutamate synthase domain-containing protein 2
MLRFIPFLAAVALAGAAVVAVIAVSPWFWLAAAPLIALSLLGIWNLVQRQHSILRNYPLIGHFRFLAEAIRPQIQQYFVENDTDGRPYSREERSLIYNRSKGGEGLTPFGTELRTELPGYAWVQHSLTAHEVKDSDFRTTVGNESCAQPYSCSVLNVSSMSFGAISPNAIRALNRGARLGGFAQWTGEGGLSEYHLENGGDLCWQIGTGYFGCRTKDGNFDPELFAKAVAHPAVKMVEIKLSQGAKPGHGGVLPAAKVTAEISRVRGVLTGVDCISPPGHSAFSTPAGLCAFVAELRRLSEGKPVGFKLCIGDPIEFMAICKAMVATDIVPDFITVDGGEGGTGAAPEEFPDFVGMPLFVALSTVHQVLRGAGLRRRTKLAASGRVYSAASIVACMALGADWCNAARAFMMSVGCLQTRKCHTNRCPVGVATQDPVRQRALDVGLKSERAYRFHKSTLSALAQLIGAMGLDHPAEITPDMFRRRRAYGVVEPVSAEIPAVDEGALLDGRGPEMLQSGWNLATADMLRPQRPAIRA